MTEKFYLRPLKMVLKDYFKDQYATWANNAEVTKYLYQGTFPVEPDDTGPVYDSYIDHSRNLVFAIYRKLELSTSSPQMVGLVGIHEIDWISGVGEFRILIGEQRHWGKGLGKTFLEEMMEQAFEKYNFHKLWLGYNAGHQRAEGAYTKSGFKKEAVLQKHHFKNGQYNDLVRMCMFRDDYWAWKAQEG